MQAQAATFEPAVTVSATYGSGGSVIAPRLAKELGLAFVDRLLSADLSQEAARSQEGLSESEREASPTGRFLSYFARAASVGSMMAPDAVLEDDESIRRRVEEGLQAVLNGAGAVVLGRAGAIVLARRPRTFHVRLDGPVDRRVERAAEYEGLDIDVARKRQQEADKARMLFVKRLYHTDPSDWRLYHMVLDTTVFGTEESVSVLASAARAFFEAA
jgi:cytidylate kinase